MKAPILALTLLYIFKLFSGTDLKSLGHSPSKVEHDQ